MSRKRASLLTIGSLAALSKVSTSCKSLNSIQTRALLIKNLSTAPQTFDFQNPNGFDGDDGKEYQQNHSGFYSNNPNNVTFQHETSGHGQGWAYRGNDREFQRSSDAFHKSDSNGVGQNPRINLQHNPVGQSGQNPRIDFQQNPVSQNYNFNGYCTANSGKLWQNPSGFNSESSRTLEQNTHKHYTGSTGNFQHIQGNNYGGNGNFQHGHGDNFPGNAGLYQQNPSGYHGDNVESPNGYLRSKVGEYQQNPIGNYRSSVGHYQHISNESHNGMVDPQESSNFRPQGELVEAAQGSVLSGTVDELDNFCKEGKLKETMEVLGLLEQNRIPIDMSRYLMLMKACGEARALQEAKAIHEHLVRSVSHLEVSTYNKILEMYSKCGSMADAYTVFDKMPQRNLTSWDTMVTWLAMNGLGEDAIELFTQFKESGLKPDGQMFFGVFSACSVLGDVDEGLLHFESMSKNYGIDPSMEHYVSIVDMLGSAGYLDEALEFIEKMPKNPSVGVWETLMNLCRIHGNMELGDRCAELIEILDPSFLNEQSKAGLIPIKTSDIAKEREKKKLSGQNLLEVRSRVHEYRAGDTSHPDNDKIYALLRGMKQQLKEAGYVPETKFVLHDIDQEGKEEALLAHSERLAVAQGLMTSPARAPMRIIKNLRVCGDCHNALKIISKLVGRELIIRDAKRFHHFKDGLCSCRDYW